MSTAPATVSSPDDPALLRIDGPIATITLNRPAAFNSINLAIAQKLEALSAEVEASDEIRVLVIEGEGRAFCAGGDLQTIGAAAEANTVTPVVGELLKHYHAFIETVRRMPKIVLSSVHGSAAGAGMGSAFVTDLCIAADDARFTPAYSKIGVSPDGGGTVGVVGTVGTRRALQIISSEDSFTAQQAHEWGLVAKIVPAAELKAATRQFAQRLAQNPPAGDRRHQVAGLSSATTPIRQQLDAEEHKIITAMHTEDFGCGEEVHEQNEVDRFPSLIARMPRGGRRDRVPPSAMQFGLLPSSLFELRRATLRSFSSSADHACYPSRSRRLCSMSRRSSSGRYSPSPPGDLKQPTDSGITCLGSHSTTLGK